MLGTGTPIVVVGRKVPGFPTANVTTNNRQGANDAVTYMLSKNLRRIAFIYGQFESVTAIEDRYNGYRDALVENNIPFDGKLVVNTNSGFNSGAEAVRQLLANRVTFDGIFASNDLIALSCIQQLETDGIKIPDNISVMGYDMIPFSQIRHPKLSTVFSNIEAMAAEAVRVVLMLINNEDGVCNETIFQAELALGGTTV
jgi:DNA-binding LacI/PurR family transcriptional regulator